MLKPTTTNISELSCAEKSSMYALFEQYYASTSVAEFEQDLAEKDCALILKSGDNGIAGFTTLKLMPFSTNNIDGRAVFSGDTIIHHDYWGDQTLPRAWCELVGRIKAQSPAQPLYWFLITKGHRTYRYLNAFTYKFYPNRRETTPETMQSVIDTLAAMKFGNAYIQPLGIIRFPSSKGHLKGPWAEIPHKYRNHPDVQYFLQRNPNFHCGDELVCITELSSANMKYHARRAFELGMRRAVTGQSAQVEVGL